MKATGIDTLFLSLGGAGKILYVELAEEMGVRTFGAASMLWGADLLWRGWEPRSPAHPFSILYRMPFSVWRDGIGVYLTTGGTT